MIATDAVMDPTGTYRYRLTRTWDDNAPTMLVVALNPSTADETVDDNTIRRCIGFAQRDGYGTLLMGNLFAYRTHNPRRLKEAVDPVGPDNDRHLSDMARSTVRGVDKIVVAWGANPLAERRGTAVGYGVLRPHGDLWSWGRTASGAPRHPLYLPKTATLGRWWP